MQQRALIFLQLPATAAALGWVPGNTTKLMAFVAIWAAGFGRLSPAEWVGFGGVNLMFVILDWGAIGKDVFHFEHPDLLGLPLYEYFMWGFYSLHSLRLLGGAPPREHIGVSLAAAAAFATPFMTITDPTMLACAAGLALGAAFVAFHEPLDFSYAGYMLGVGAVFEYVGTATGQWSYPHAPYGGVPIWSAVMWGGVGLFIRRLIQPLVYRRSPPVPGTR